MGNAWSSFRKKRNERKRKLKPCHILSESEKEDIIRRKAQMEQQNTTLQTQISLEETARRMARRNSPHLRENIAWNSQIRERAKTKLEAAAQLRSKVLESRRPVKEGSLKYGKWAQCPTCSHRVYLRYLADLEALQTCD